MNVHNLAATRPRRVRLEALIEEAIALLDALDGDRDLEEGDFEDPSWPEDIAASRESLTGDDDEPEPDVEFTLPEDLRARRPDLPENDELEDGADEEPTLGAGERFNANQEIGWWSGPTSIRRVDLEDDDDLEPDHEGEPSLGATEHLDQEAGWRPTDGWSLNNDAEVNEAPAA